MDLQHKIQELVQRIGVVFPQDPVPPPDGLISDECNECFALRNDFSGYRWPEVPRKILEIHYDDLPLFAPVAYHYYLPSYLSYSLQRVPPTDEDWIAQVPPSLSQSWYQPMLDFTVYSLCPSGEAHWVERYKTYFFAAQAEVIKDWLSLVLENPDPFDVDEPVARMALDQYWLEISV